MRLPRYAAALTVLVSGSFWLPAQQSGAAADQHQARSVLSVVEGEHRELHQKLNTLVKAGGDTGRAARAVEELLRPHFVKEEQFALPPLRALPGLAFDKLPGDANELIHVADQLSRDMPTMLAEHEKIHGALRRLQTAAEKEGNPEGTQFAKALAAHAAMEEQVLYPAAVLVGRYLKLKAR